MCKFFLAFLGIKIIMLLKIDISLQAGCQESSKLVAIKTARQSHLWFLHKCQFPSTNQGTVMNM